MTKKIIFTSVCAILSLGAFAETPKDMMARLTEEQKACVATLGCVVPEQPETTVAMNTFMECMKKASISCGLQPQEAPVIDAHAPEGPQSEAPAIPASADEAPATDAPVPDLPAPEAPVIDAPAPETPVQEAVVEQISETSEPASQE